MLTPISPSFGSLTSFRRRLEKLPARPKTASFWMHTGADDCYACSSPEENSCQLKEMTLEENNSRRCSFLLLIPTEYINIAY